MAALITQPLAPPPHTLSVAELCAGLQSSPVGLTGVEARRRSIEFGANELRAAHRVSPWAMLLAQLRNVLIVVLLMATALSAMLGHGIEAAAISVIVLFAVLLGFVQEYRAERAIEALRQMAAPTATVRRDGEESEVPARELVPGDVVILRAGNRVPADARLIEAVNLQIQEAVLTGESMAVEKQVEPLVEPQLALGDRHNMAYAGTTASYGRGLAMVVATGMQTEFGKIAQMLQGVETGKTPLQIDLDQLGRTLARIALAVVAVIVALGLLRGQPFIDMLVFGIALAVAVVPEALPAVVTISLAIGVQRLVRRGALMRRLAAVETLGSTSIICSDKTGTLTKDQMTVRKLHVAGQGLEVSGTGYEPHGQFTCGGLPVEPSAPLQRLLRAAVLASDAYIVHADGRWQVKGDPTEGALVVVAAKAGLRKVDLDGQFPRLHEIPFSAESKRMTTLHRLPEGVAAYAKGAPEVILAACSHLLTADGEDPFDEHQRALMQATTQRMAGEGLRVLAVAARTGATPDNAEQDLTLLGLLGMFDPPRPEAAEAIQTCVQAGIRVLMITGDHPLTARAVAGELGLLKSGRVITGDELEAMSEAELARTVRHANVYARISPQHKLRVVSSLQLQGHIVAMTGDGVNDAPALKKADIGIAMGITGTDVAREAAAMTLTDDNFASIVAAVEEGRGIFANIRKYLMYLLSSNFGEIGLIAGAALLGLPIPLSAVQILYVNLATDGLPALALAVDPAEPEVMRRKPRDPRQGLFSRPVMVLIGIGGLWSMLVNLSLFAWALSSGRSVAEAMAMTFISLVLIQFLKAYNFRSDRRSALHRPFANKWLNWAVLWELALLSLVIYLPALQEPFGTFNLAATDWALVVGLALTILPVLEAAKWMGRHGWFGQMT